MTDPIDAEKLAKPRPDLIPAVATFEEGRALAAGARKHGAHNYLIPGHEQNLVDTHFASAMRHINAWHGGESVDPASGADQLLHLACARAQLGIMLDLLDRERRGTRKYAPSGEPTSEPTSGYAGGATETEQDAGDRC